MLGIILLIILAFVAISIDNYLGIKPRIRRSSFKGWNSSNKRSRMKNGTRKQI